MHALLARQLRRHFPGGVPPELDGFLRDVDQTYADADGDRARVERSLDLMSRELLESNVELRANHLEHQVIFDAVPAMIFTKDTNNRILKANKAGAAVFGRPVAEVEGRNAAELLPPDVAAALHRDDLLVIQSARPKLGIIESHPGGDGRLHWMQTDKVPLFDDRGHVRGVLVLSVDITSQVQAEQDLKRAYDQLKQVDATRARFLNSAAHELGTPLTPVLLQMKVVRNKLQVGHVEEAQQSIRVMERNIERLARLTRDLLDAARIQVDHMRLRPQVADLAESARLAVETYQPVAVRDGVRLELESDGPAPCRFDTGRIGQVFDNLLSNAMKFTPRGGHVTVLVQRLQEMTQVTVADDGAGIAPEDVGRLFKPFVQVHDALQATGTGLGLYVARGIVQAHGGDMGVESEGLGRGSRFWFRVPHAVPGAPVPSADTEAFRRGSARPGAAA